MEKQSNMANVLRASKRRSSRNKTMMINYVPEIKNAPIKAKRVIFDLSLNKIHEYTPEAAGYIVESKEEYSDFPRINTQQNTSNKNLTENHNALQQKGKANKKIFIESKKSAKELIEFFTERSSSQKQINESVLIASELELLSTRNLVRNNIFLLNDIQKNRF